jgi:hypothetical protein
MTRYNINGLIFISVLITCTVINAQESNCKVVMGTISESYSGKCKNGLAQGKGIAQGTDHYEGQFNKGLPDGMGVYTWADGTYYDGQWKNGMKEGKGKMVYKDSVVTGYWRANSFVGAKLVSPYRVTQSLSVTRYTFTKTVMTANGIRLRILQGGTENSGIEDFSLVYSSGEEYRNGSIIGIQNVMYPVDVKIRYRSWNQLRTAQYNVIFEFTIVDPGTWEIMISN